MFLRTSLVTWLCLFKTTSLSWFVSPVGRCYFYEFGSESQFDLVDGAPLFPTRCGALQADLGRYLGAYSSARDWYIGTALLSYFLSAFLQQQHSVVAALHGASYSVDSVTVSMADNNATTDDSGSKLSLDALTRSVPPCWRPNIRFFRFAGISKC